MERVITYWNMLGPKWQKAVILAVGIIIGAICAY